jgi:hypothetical protein
LNWGFINRYEPIFKVFKRSEVTKSISGEGDCFTDEWTGFRDNTTIVAEIGEIPYNGPNP